MGGILTGLPQVAQLEHFTNIATNPQFGSPPCAGIIGFWFAKGLFARNPTIQASLVGVSPSQLLRLTLNRASPCPLKSGRPSVT